MHSAGRWLSRSVTCVLNLIATEFCEVIYTHRLQFQFQYYINFLHYFSMRCGMVWDWLSFHRNVSMIHHRQLKLRARIVLCKALFTSREGNPSARVTLAGGSKIARVYKQNFTGRVTLPPGTT